METSKSGTAAGNVNWNIGGCGGNTVHGNLKFNNNPANGNTVSNNHVAGDLACKSNGAIESGSNRVLGRVTGQSPPREPPSLDRLRGRRDLKDRSDDCPVPPSGGAGQAGLDPGRSAERGGFRAARSPL